MELVSAAFFHLIKLVLLPLSLVRSNQGIIKAMNFQIILKTGTLKSVATALCVL